MTARKLGRVKERDGNERKKIDGFSKDNNLKIRYTYIFFIYEDGGFNVLYLNGMLIC